MKYLCDDDAEQSESQASAQRPVGVYLIAIYFTAVWLFSMGSLVYVLFFRLTPEMRHQLDRVVPRWRRWRLPI